MQNNRIAYIDALRGFTMLLVVMQHVETFGIHCLWSGTFVETFFLPFRMPLFFFISGFVTYKAIERFTPSFTWEMACKKMVHLMIPLVVFCFLFSLVNKWNQTIYDGGVLLGYWFSLVLLEMALVYFLLSLASRFSKDWVLDAGLIVCAILLYILRTDIPQTKTTNLLCLRMFARYFQFFALGILCKRHIKIFQFLTTNSIAIALSIVVYIACIYFNHFKTPVVSGKVSEMIVVPIAGILAMVSFFKANEDFFQKDGFISRAMRFIGTRTLDIYMLHYFLLPELGFLKPFVVNYNNVVLEVAIVGIVSLLIISACLLISAIIRNSDLLGHFLFAAKSDKYKI